VTASTLIAMGLLDDAIREHLDLKRQRGADPGEIERAEREALSPVRRDPDGESEIAEPEAEHEPEVGEAVGAEQGEFDESEQGESDEPDDAEHPSDDENELEAGTGEHAAPSTHARTVEPVVDTVEFEVEDKPHPPAEEGHGDVLEKTPEFLQDAPDHDRLWFEQRPPRDFDFDS